MNATSVPPAPTADKIDNANKRLPVDKKIIQRMSAAIALVSLIVLTISFLFLPSARLTTQSFMFVGAAAVIFFILYVLLPTVYLHETFLMFGDAVFIAVITYFAAIAGQYGVLILFLYFVIIVADALKYPLSEYIFVVLVTLQAAFFYVILWAPFEPRVKVGILILFASSTISIATFTWYFVNQTIYERSMRYLLERKSKYLEDMNKHLQAVDSMRSNMLKVTSHEFQTPLAGIKNSLTLLHGNDFGKLTPKQLKLVEMAVQNNDRLSGLMRSLLDTSRIQNGNWKLNAVTLHIKDILADVVKGYEQQADSKKVHLEVKLTSTNPTIEGDAHLVQIACHNIVDNAIKYTQDEGHVTVELHDDDKYVSIVVADSGIGIDDETQKNLFAQFARGDKAIAASPDGYGIGLYYTKLIVDKHHGTIKVDSKPGKGAVFTLTFPKTKKTNHTEVS